MTRLLLPMCRSRRIAMLKSETFANLNGTSLFFLYPLHKTNCFQFKRFISSNLNDNERRRSPYSVLQIKTSSTEKEIKQSFRNLAKKYHPDLNPNKPMEELNSKMSEIIEAYDQLMSDEFGAKVGDSRVALACEMYTIDELKLDRFHDVYTLRVNFDNLTSNNDVDDMFDTVKVNLASHLTNKKAESRELDTSNIIDVSVHPDDSISDLKRQLQAKYNHEWDLAGRRRDRDGVGTGWELITSEGSILGSCFFLSSYDIHHRDTLYTIVRRYDETMK